MREVDKEDGLREQHKVQDKERYNGHNRHPGLTIHTLGARRNRRHWNEIARILAQEFNNRD